MYSKSWYVYFALPVLGNHNWIMLYSAVHCSSTNWEFVSRFAPVAMYDRCIYVWGAFVHVNSRCHKFPVMLTTCWNCCLYAVIYDGCVGCNWDYFSLCWFRSTRFCWGFSICYLCFCGIQGWVYFKIVVSFKSTGCYHDDNTQYSYLF